MKNLPLTKINEIFVSIQGEGFHTGRPAAFVRFQGCECHCPFCDTKQSWMENAAQYQMSNIGICHALQEATEGKNIDTVIITGGEPLLQAEQLDDLLFKLSTQGLFPHVHIETSGSVKPDETISSILNLQNVWLTVSPKSKQLHELYYFNANEIKCLIGAEMEDDIIPESVWDDMKEHTLVEGSIFLQPIDYGNEEKNAASVKRAFDMCLEYGVFLSGQMHKYLKLQ